MHRLPREYGGAYSTGKTRNEQRRHGSISWNPCKPVKNTTQQGLIRGSTLSKGERGQTGEEGNGSPELVITVYSPGGLDGGNSLHGSGISD